VKRAIGLRELPALGAEPAYYSAVRQRWGETVVSRDRVHVLAHLPAVVAEIDGRPAGCLAFARGAAAVEIVTLDAFVPGRGVGRALLGAVAGRADRIWLVTTNDNASAQRFYAAAGMALVAVHRGAVRAARILKPDIPLTGEGGVPIEDELEYELRARPGMPEGAAAAPRQVDAAACAVRRLAAVDWPLYRYLRMRALAEAPDAFSSTLAEALPRGDADWQLRLAAADPSLDLPLVAYVDRVAAGLVWGRIDAAEPAVAHVFQMWVDPGCRGGGVGGLLLAAVRDWAAGGGARELRLGVTRGNGAAERLYRSAGFVATGASEPLRPGSDRVVDSMSLDLDEHAR
jgi:ribosomal protein S18 acetylase RimI-like enzyme